MTLLRRLAAPFAAAAVALTMGTASLAFEPVPTPDAYPERVLGSPDAPVTMVEYSSLTCPACAGFHTDVMPQIKQEYVDTGKVRIVYRDFPLDNLALGAAIIGRCAAEDRFFPLLNMLYANQQQWARSRNPLEALQGYGRLAGLSAADIDSCLENEALVLAVQQVRQDAAETYGVRSTPSFVINGEVVAGNVGMAQFSEILARHGAN